MKAPSQWVPARVRRKVFKNYLPQMLCDRRPLVPWALTKAIERLVGSLDTVLVEFLVLGRYIDVDFFLDVSIQEFYILVELPTIASSMWMP